jgi:hypothetical protein
MEMAFGKIASCLILAGSLWPAEFAVRHEHLRKGCAGVITVDEAGIRFMGAKKHTWSWKYDDIEQLTLAPGRLHILTYRDSKLRLGADVAYTFTGKIPVDTLYAQWRAKLDQRFVAAVAAEESSGPAPIPVKLVGRIKGSEGILTIAPESVVYATHAADARTWRYSDIRFISSSGPFQLTITTFEKQFHFQLKQAMSESRYNQLWLDIEKRNGRIQ